MSESVKTAKTAREIDEAFDRGEDMSAYFDFSSATIEEPKPSYEQRPMSLNLPAWLIAAMDEEAARRGTTRASVAKNWLVDRADQERERRARLAS